MFFLWSHGFSMCSLQMSVLFVFMRVEISNDPHHHHHHHSCRSHTTKTAFRQEIERKLSSRHLPTDCLKDEKLFRTTLFKAASHHISTGRRKLDSGDNSLRA